MVFTLWVVEKGCDWALSMADYLVASRSEQKEIRVVNINSVHG